MIEINLGKWQYEDKALHLKIKNNQYEGVLELSDSKKVAITPINLSGLENFKIQDLSEKALKIGEFFQENFYPIISKSLQGEEYSIRFHPRCLGGGRDGGLFNACENKVTRKLGENLPRWREVYPGLNLLGKCENAYCDAYKDWVYAPKGFEPSPGTSTFNILREDSNTDCPSCYKRLNNVEEIHFFKCKYSLEGEKINRGWFLSSNERVHDTGTASNDDETVTFSSTNKKHWIWIQVNVEKL